MNKTKKSILYVGGFELPDKNAAAHRVISNAKIFKDLGYDVIFIGISKELDRNTKISNKQLLNNEFSYYSIPYPHKIQDWLGYLGNVSYLDLIKQIEPQIIIAYNYPSLALQKLIHYSNRNNIKIIADVTEWYQPDGNLFHKALKYMDTSYRMKVLHKRMDGLIVISSFLYNYYKHFVNTIEVPPLVDLSLEKWKKNENDEEINNEEVIKLIYAGSPSTKKDHLDKIISMIFQIIREKSQRIQLKVTGITKEQFMNLYQIDKEIIKELDFFVEFEGRLSHIETIRYIQNSDFHIFIRENNLVNTAGFPTKFVESLSCGTPVITNLSSNLNDYLINGVNGYAVDISNDDNFYRSFSMALSFNREQLNEMKKKSRDTQIFDYRQYISLFNVFLNKI